MSFKTILTHVVADPAGQGALRTACDLAALLQGHLVGVGAEAGGEFNFSPREAPGSPSKNRLALAASTFAEAAAGLEAGSTWLQAHEAPLRVLQRYADLADVVVAHRPGERDDPRRGAPLDDVLLELGLPVLVSIGPDAPFSLDRVMLAWDGSRECRRVIADALPLLTRAGSVAVVAVGVRAENEAALADAVARLSRHGVGVSISMIERDWRAGGVAEQLNKAADDRRADLIVLGAYGRMHLKEWAFGGVTQAMLGSADRHLFFSR